MSFQHQIQEALQRNGYDADLARLRAPQVFRFFEFTKLEQRLIIRPSRHFEEQFEFLTGDDSCSVDHAEHVTFRIIIEPKTRTTGGSWMESAPLTYLARVCDLGCRWYGEKWFTYFTKRLADRTKLLDVLNEVWWLGVWKDIRNPQMSVRAKDGGNYDWYFSLGDTLKVNLQVKRRRNDLPRKSLTLSPPFTGLFDKLSKRFSASGPDQVNMGAITVYSGIDHDVLRAVDNYFRIDESRHVDAIILWSPESPEPLQPYFLRARKFRDLLKGYVHLDPLDSRYSTISVHGLSLEEAINAPMVAPLMR